MTTQTAAARARATDPATSHAAAASLRPSDTEATRRIVRMLLRVHGPATDEQVATRYAAFAARHRALAPLASLSGLRTRRAELVRVGEVVDTGRRAETASGRTAIVWAVA